MNLQIDQNSINEFIVFLMQTAKNYLLFALTIIIAIIPILSNGKFVNEGKRKFKKRIRPLGYFFILLIIAFNGITFYSSVKSLNESKAESKNKAKADSTQIAILKSNINDLKTIIQLGQFKLDSTKNDNLKYLFTQLREENYLITYTTFAADIAPRFFDNSVGLIPFKTFFLNKYIDYSKSLEVVTFLTDYLYIINQYNKLFEEINIVYTDDKKMYNEETVIQKMQIKEISKALNKISYPINQFLKESKNIEEFDLKISKYVSSINEKKKKKGIPDIKKMGGFLYK